MSKHRVSINMHLSGTIALADLAAIAHMIQPESCDYPGEVAVKSAYQPNVGESTLSNTGNSSTITLVADTSTAETLTSTALAATEATDDGTLDTDGWPWSADLHASTKGTTKDGRWRMKVGVTRPEPKAGFPIEETPSATLTLSPAMTVAATAAEPVGSTPIEEGASAAASREDDDEFAAFHAAVAKADAVDADAKASVPARSYSDADLGALCNAAAVKMNDPVPVRELIAKFVPEGEVAHSRNVPKDKRADFVAAVEAKAGIEFAG